LSVAGVSELDPVLLAADPPPADDDGDEDDELHAETAATAASAITGTVIKSFLRTGNSSSSRL
jgi:hypothetical protein